MNVYNQLDNIDVTKYRIKFMKKKRNSFLISISNADRGSWTTPEKELELMRLYRK